MTDRNYPMGSPGLEKEVSDEVRKLEICKNDVEVYEVSKIISMLLQCVSQLVPVDTKLAHALLNFIDGYITHLEAGDVL